MSHTVEVVDGAAVLRVERPEGKNFVQHLQKNDTLTIPCDVEAAVARVRKMCEDLQVESTDGDVTDANILWPSEVLAALDGAS